MRNEKMRRRPISIIIFLTSTTIIKSYLIMRMSNWFITCRVIIFHQLAALVHSFHHTQNLSMKSNKFKLNISHIKYLIVLTKYRSEYSAKFRLGVLGYYTAEESPQLTFHSDSLTFRRRAKQISTSTATPTPGPTPTLTNFYATIPIF